MRIRKNAKISAFLYTNEIFANDADEALLKKNLCQLNQSPWDIITFPSSDSSSSLHQCYTTFDDYEIYYNVNLVENGSSVDSIGDFKSLASKTSLEGGPNNGDDGNKSNYNEYGEVLGFKEEIELCSTRDENGWQCGRAMKNGNTMCDHHLSQLQNYAVWTTKKKIGPVSGPTARPNRTKKRATTNPHDYYYYSGFGPTWGKKRGTPDIVSNVYDHEASTYDASDDKKSYENVEEEKRQRLEPDMPQVGPVKVKLDHTDDDEKGKVVIIGKKRGRKPIKARSLKSLM